MSLTRAAIAAPLLVLALAGCVPSGSTSPTPDSVTTAPSFTTNPTPTITPTPTAETEPVTFGCSDLLTAQAIYDYNPNVSLLPSFSPSGSSAAGQALAQQGLACELVNQTSGATIDFGVVQYAADAFTAKSDAVAGTSTPAASFDGYFDDGLAQFLVAPYYVTVDAPQFMSPEDIAPLVAMARAGIGV